MTIWDILKYKIAGIEIEAILKFVGAILIMVIIAKIVRTNIRRSLKDKLPDATVKNIERFSYYIIIIIGFIASLSIIGVSLSGLLVAGGILGIVIGFASQTVVSNLLSGIFLIIERPIGIGDAIRIEDADGIVEEIKILSTTIRTWDGVYVRLPNEKVFTSKIYNYYNSPVRRFEYKIGIRYSDDADKAIEIIKRVLNEHPFVLKEPAPLIFVDELGESSVNLFVGIWAPSRVWFSVKTELLWKIKIALEKEGIQIPFPQRVIWMAK